MKIIRFCLKFINYDIKKCTKIIIEVCSDKLMEWTQKRGKEGHKAHADWAAHHAIWEDHLFEIIKSIAEAFLKNQNDDFNSYYFVKKRICCEKCIINLDEKTEGQMADLHLKQTKYINIINKNFCKGKMIEGKHWTDVFKYDKVCHKLDLWLDHKNNVLIPKCYYSHPESATSHVSNEHIQTIPLPQQYDISQIDHQLETTPVNEYSKKKYKHKLFGARDENEKLHQEIQRLKEENANLRANQKGDDNDSIVYGGRKSTQNHHQIHPSHHKSKDSSQDQKSRAKEKMNHYKFSSNRHKTSHNNKNDNSSSNDN